MMNVNTPSLLQRLMNLTHTGSARIARQRLLSDLYRTPPHCNRAIRRRANAATLHTGRDPWHHSSTIVLESLLNQDIVPEA